mgnify:CR=1 FL=1
MKKNIKNKNYTMKEAVSYYILGYKRYEQNISQNSDVKQTMVDVDIVVLAGDVGAYRAGITLAENLPNDDKLSLTIGGGRKSSE